MKVYKFDNQDIQELFLLKANSKTHTDLVEHLKSIRLKFIQLCKTNDDWSTEYLTESKESISGDILKEIDLPNGHIMFYIWNNRLNLYPDLKKQFLGIIGKTHRFENWEDQIRMPKLNLFEELLSTVKIKPRSGLLYAHYS